MIGENKKIILKFVIISLIVVLSNQASLLHWNFFLFHLLGGPGIIAFIFTLFLFKNLNYNYFIFLLMMLLSSLIGIIINVSTRLNIFIWTERLAEEFLYVIFIFIPAQLIAYSVLFLFFKMMHNRLDC